MQRPLSVQVSLWVASEVIQASSLAERLKIASIFIRTARMCRTLKNFNGVLEIVSGLECAAVSRLKSVWAQLSPDDVQTFEELKVLMSPRDNYKNYRSEIAHLKAPLVPHIGSYLRFVFAICVCASCLCVADAETKGICLRDLTFICDGNPEEPGIVNIERHCLVSAVVKRMWSFARKPHPTTHYDIGIQEFLKQALSQQQDEDALFDKSLEVEPWGNAEKKRKKRAHKLVEFFTGHSPAFAIQISMNDEARSSSSSSQSTSQSTSFSQAERQNDSSSEE
jgi:hypothetical protein